MSIGAAKEGMSIVLAWIGRGQVGDIELADVLAWGDACVEAGQPALAVELAIAAKESGIGDVGPARMRAWENAGIEGKDEVEAGRYAIELFKAYNTQSYLTKELVALDHIKELTSKAVGQAEALGMTYETAKDATVIERIRQSLTLAEVGRVLTL